MPKISITDCWGVAADPHTKECNWCGAGSEAVCAYEVFKPRKKVGTAQFLYACEKHRRIARESSRAPKAAA